MNELFHSVEEKKPLNYFKDLHLLLMTIFVFQMPFSAAESGELTNMFLVTFLWFGPLVVFWTPYVQERISFKQLNHSRNAKYLWLIYLGIFMLPIIGSFLFLIRLLLYYNDEDAEETLNITSVDERNFESSENQSIEDNDSNLNTVKEYKRTCNECGKTWHSLAKRERKLKRSKMWDECAEGVRACGCNYAAEAQHRRNKQETQSTLDELKQCSECGSRNYDEEVIEYEDN